MINHLACGCHFASTVRHIIMMMAQMARNGTFIPHIEPGWMPSHGYVGINQYFVFTTKFS